MALKLNRWGDRIPPHNAEAEQALLGALLANAKAYDAVSEFLQPHHFADPVHAEIYAAISRRLNAGGVADPVTLRAEFENSGRLADAGLPYLAQLLSAMTGIINAGDYGRTIYDAWMRRELISSCTETINQCYAPEGGLTGGAIMEALDGALSNIAAGAGDTRPAVPAVEAIALALKAAQAAADRGSGLAGITTGYAALNRLIGGFMPEQVYLLGARPAMGKTGLGLGIAARVAAAGHSTLYWSGEMSAAQLGTRLAAAHAGLDVMSVFRGRAWVVPDPPDESGYYRALDSGEWARLIDSGPQALRLPLAFDDRSAITVAALRFRARQMRRSKAGLDLIVVDYIALMRATPQTERQKLYERVTELSRDIKALAVELGVPVLALTQLNRGNEARENKLPQLHDLRDSGALEQDATAVLFLHRPHYYLVQAGRPVQGPKEDPAEFDDRSARYYRELDSTKDSAIISVAKNRNGPTGQTRLKFTARTIWFRDEGEDPGSPAWGDLTRGVL